MSIRNRIFLKGHSYRIEEDKAVSAVTPGQLLVLSATGVAPQTAEGTAVERAIALENALCGSTIDTAYAQGEIVQYAMALPGDVVYGTIIAAQTIVVGSPLTTGGAGGLKLAGGSDAVVAIALEAVTTTASTARLPVRVL